MASQLNSSPTGSNQNVSGGSTAWSNPTRVVANDNSRATAALAALGASQDLRALFSFSIPASATPDGYLGEAAILASAGFVTDGPIRLWQGGSVIGADQDRGAGGSPEWPTTEAYVSWGGATDKWSTTLSAAQVNSGTLGFSICADSQNFGAVTVECDHMRMTVYYTDVSGWLDRGPWRGLFRGILRRVRTAQSWFGVPPERRWLIQAAHGVPTRGAA